MKQFLLLFACLFTVGMSAQTVLYVDADATGSGDGTTFTDAYTELHSALNNAPAGAIIVVADGTYTADSTFVIDKDLTLLGGFDGTETSTDQADPAKNITILSGDVMGNDTADVFSPDVQGDNNRVLLVMDTSTQGGPSFTCRIDGFTIANGVDVNTPTTNFDTITDGGGMRVMGQTIATRLRFVNNRSRAGSALTAFGANASGSVFEDIVVERNFTDGGRLNAFSLRGVNNVRVTRGTFSGFGETNPTARGALSIIFSSNILVDDCSFTGLSTNTDGSAIYLQDNGENVTISNSSFTNLISGRGAVRLANFNFRSNTTFENCTFDNCDGNENSNFITGGLYASGANLNLVNTDFSNCDAGPIGLGGAVQFRAFAGPGVGDDTLDVYQLSIDNCSFNSNTAQRGEGFGGGAITIFGFDDIGAELTVRDSEFNRNVSSALDANSRGGAIFSFHFGGAPMPSSITNTTFTENNGDVGGALLMVPTDVSTFSNCSFTNNTSNFGGAGLFFTRATTTMRFDSCEFTNNSAEVSGGAIYHGGPFATDAAARLIINDCSFETNSGGNGGTAGGGGAIFSFDGVDLSVTDSEFIENSITGEFSSGGAISVDTRETSRDTIDGEEIIGFSGVRASTERSLFLNNSAIIQGGAINMGFSVMDLVNNIFVFNSIVTPMGDPGGGSVSGGAVIFNGNSASAVRDEDGNVTGFRRAGSLALEANVIHNTFADNFKGSNDAAVGNQIALFQPGETVFNEGNSMTINLLNNAFILSNAVADEEDQIAFEPGREVDGSLQAIGEINVNSLGGNFFNVAPGVLEFELTDQDIVTQDIDDISSVLTDVDGFDDDQDNDFALLDDDNVDNPLVDGGVANDLVPEVDFFGNTRDQSTPDIGAITTDMIDNVTVLPIDQSGIALDIFPNPTAGVVNLRNNEAGVSSYHIALSDAQGRVLTTRKITRQTATLNLADYATGAYNLMLIVDGKLYSKQLIRQ